MHAPALATLAFTALGVLTIAGVAAATVKVERTALRFQQLRRSISRIGGTADSHTPDEAADNAWLTRVVRSFPD